MPTIRIEDDVFEGLQRLAKPFTDTPNSVIRRLLVEKRVLAEPQADASAPQPSAHEVDHESRPSKPRIRRLTPQPVYEKFVLHTMATQFEGEADKIDVTKAVISSMKSHGFLGPADEVRVSTGETKAENTVAWARNALKERGLISRKSPRGVWALTPSGMQAGKSITLPTNVLGNLIRGAGG
jgi:hypothetical protein